MLKKDQDAARNLVFQLADIFENTEKSVKKNIVHLTQKDITECVSVNSSACSVAKELKGRK